MSRLAPLDKALVLILVPLWVVFIGLSVKTQFEGGGYDFVGLSLADSESYPVYNGEPESGRSRALESGLVPGDVLLRVGNADLRGVNGLGLLVRIIEQADRGLSVPVVLRRNGEQHEVVLRLRPLSNYRPWVVASFAWALSAIFLLLRAQPTPTVRAYFHAGMCLSFVLGALVGGGYGHLGRALLWVQISAQSLYFPLLLRFNFLFPDDRTPGGRWHRIWPWLFVALGPIFVWTHVTGRWSIGQPLYMGTIGLGGMAILAVAAWKYRHIDPVARRQFRWVVVGAYAAALPVALTSGLLAIDPRFEQLWLLSVWAVPLFPAFVLVSVVRFNLFDVDRVLSAAASYNVLAVLLGAGALIGVPRIAEVASGLVGIDPATSQVVLSLALAALVVPAHRRLRPQIDRLFFKERYAVDHGIAELLPKLAHCRDARDLTERVGEGLLHLLRPEACVVYAAGERSYTPVFAEGQALPPAFETDSPLVGTLRKRRAPLSLSSVGRRPDEAHLSRFDRAALETLQAEVVVPVHRSGALTAFLCLGPKRSGDVYTSTDLSLLAAVAETVSQQLRRFDQEQTIREGREMQESLRRYVPGAVAEQLTSGAELASGEREVSVLFADIRGYTGFAENRQAEEIFSTVNRYTEAVSQIVQEHGGSVVEFNGDGMMAVFGAPRKIAHKERAAVEAGRAIVAAVGALPVADPSGGQTLLSVGVGIATGEAFVGNIQAVDRMIWSAIGNTTNLAARLQGLTRELDASVVIDAATWERAQHAAEGFEKHSDLPIRGRRETQDVYALAITRAAA